MRHAAQVDGEVLEPEDVHRDHARRRSRLDPGNAPDGGDLRQADAAVGDVDELRPRQVIAAGEPRNHRRRVRQQVVGRVPFRGDDTLHVRLRGPGTEDHGLEPERGHEQGHHGSERCHPPSPQGTQDEAAHLTGFSRAGISNGSRPAVQGTMIRNIAPQLPNGAVFASRSDNAHLQSSRACTSTSFGGLPLTVV